MSGSLILNRAFEDLIKSIIGENLFISNRDTDRFRLLMSRFEEVKNSFYEASDYEEVTFNVPGQGLALHKLTLTRYDHQRGHQRLKLMHYTSEQILTCQPSAMLRHIFEPVVTEIERLVLDQIQKAQIVRLKEHPGGDKIELFLSLQQELQC